MKTDQMKWIGADKRPDQMPKMRPPHILCESVVDRSCGLWRHLGRFAVPRRRVHPSRRAASTLRIRGLLGRQIGCGGGHVLGAPLQRVQLVRSCCLWGCVLPRLPCHVSGMDAAQGGNKRARPDIPYIAKPRAQTRRKSVCVNRPSARVGRHLEFFGRSKPEISGMAGSTWLHDVV